MTPEAEATRTTEEVARSYFERVAARDPDGMMDHWTPGGTGHIYGLAELTAGTGVTVNSVLPGPTRSEGVGDFVRDFAASEGVDEAAFERDFFENARPTSLLKRFETPEEIASVVAFVCSPLASSINGASVRADGGVIRAIA